jgi:hypothetical protein
MNLILRWVRRKRLGLLGSPPAATSRGVGLGFVAAVTVPAHGYVINSKGLVSTGSTAGPLMGWLRRFAGACLWAAAIAAGLIIYQHFTAKWKDAGYPVIPISALAAIDQAVNTSGKGPAIPLGGGAGNAHNTEASKRQTSFLDALEFEG